MSSLVAPELRSLCDDIEGITHASPCCSIAWPIIRNAIDHLTALAVVYERQGSWSYSAEGITGTLGPCCCPTGAPGDEGTLEQE